MDFLTANDRPGAYPASYYAATADTLPLQPTLFGETRADVCVVGGGYMGLSTALHLAERGYSVTLIEAQRVGFGASGRNGGQVSADQRLDQQTLEKMVGPEMAHRLWDIAQQSAALVKSLAAQHDIDIGWRDGIIHADHRARYVKETHEYADFLAKNYNYDKISPLSREAIRDLVRSDAYHGGSLDMGGGHLHPLRYALGLARACLAAGVRIYEQTRVIDIVHGTPAKVVTQDGHVMADHVVMGCNGYLGKMQGHVAARVMPINNFIAATEPLADPDAVLCNGHAVADSKYVINYFRLSEDNRMLFGGGESYGYKFPKDIAATVRKPMAAIFPQLADVRIDYAWGGTLGITMNRMPHFERLSGNILSLSGFSGHGVAMATMAGKIAAEAVAGQAERFDVMAQVPTLRFPGGAAFRWPLLVLAMVWYGMLDRI